MKRLLIISFLFYIMAGLSIYIIKNDASAQVLYNNNNKVNTQNILRRDGIYNTYDTSTMPCGEKINEHCYTYNHINIINSHVMLYNEGMGSYDDWFLLLKAYLNIDFRKTGNYEIVNDTLFGYNISIPLMTWGGRLKEYHVNYEGYIKNADTIIGWHMIPPYPKASRKFNNDFKDLIQPKMLYFIESKELLGLDSLYHKKMEEQYKH